MKMLYRLETGRTSIYDQNSEDAYINIKHILSITKLFYNHFEIKMTNGDSFFINQKEYVKLTKYINEEGI